MNFTEACEIMALDAAARRLNPRTIVCYRERIRTIIKIAGDKRIDFVTSTELRLVHNAGTARCCSSVSFRVRALRSRRYSDVKRGSRERARKNGYVRG